jgi:hypothetical protein
MTRKIRVRQGFCEKNANYSAFLTKERQEVDFMKDLVR